MSNSFNDYEFSPQEDSSSLTGTSLQGTITASFAQLEDCLGAPSFEGKGDNITTEFVVKWSKYDTIKGSDYIGDREAIGTFSIYDWHYARNFNNDYETLTWNIGGQSYNDVMAADALLEKFA